MPPDGLKKSVTLLKEKYGLRIKIEPGAGLVRSCGSLISRVVDICDNGDVTVATLDTTVNHLPEVFEYQYTPDVSTESERGEFSYVLAGGSCLAGDVFGEYAFDSVLSIGSLIKFVDVGAYAQVKSHTFNGISLPATYEILPDGSVKLKSAHTYEQFRQLSLATDHL